MTIDIVFYICPQERQMLWLFTTSTFEYPYLDTMEARHKGVMFWRSRRCIILAAKTGQDRLSAEKCLAFIRTNRRLLVGFCSWSPHLCQFSTSVIHKTGRSKFRSTSIQIILSPKTSCWLHFLHRPYLPWTHESFSLFPKSALYKV